MQRRKRPLMDRLMDRVVADGDCWRFTGATVSGYGTLGRGARGEGNVLAHRATYEFFIGEVPPGLDLDHLCRNRWCCNPWHLEPVTRLVNVSRGLRAPGYRVTHCPRGHEFTPENTIQTTKQRHCRTCTTARRALARKAA